MVKAAAMGRVKTRLGKDIGAVAATRFFRTTSRNVIGRLASDPRWETVLAVSPDTALGAPIWPRGLRQIGQRHGDLGVRMWRVAQQRRRGPVLIVGTDIPGITATRIALALKALAGHDAVLGPAGDGGYWCIGFSRSRAMRSPFDRVRWSDAHALADTQAGFDSARVARTTMIEDVDNGGEFFRYGELGVRRVFVPGRAGNRSGA